MAPMPSTTERITPDQDNSSTETPYSSLTTTTSSKPTSSPGISAPANNSGDTDDDNLFLYITVSVASVFATMCIVGILYCVRKKQQNSKHSV